MNGHSFLDPAMVNRLTNLTLESRRPVVGSVSGRHRSPVRGSSLEFAQYRSYQIGDDTRRLDWRVWARTDRAYVKEFEADTNLRMQLVVDASGSMNYSNSGSTIAKLDQAKQMAGALAWVAIRQGDAVGIACSGAAKAKEIPPKRGARHLKAVLDRIEGIRADGECNLPQQLHWSADRLPRRGLVVIVSDLFVDLEELRQSIRHLLYRRHDVVLLHLLDTSEIQFHFDQPMRFIDLEGGVPVLSDPVLVGDDYRRIVSEYLSTLDEMVRTTAIDYRRISLTTDVTELLASVLRDRSRRKSSRSRRT